MDGRKRGVSGHGTLMTTARVFREMGEQLDERTLIARAKRGDREAFDVIARRHLPRVYGLLKRVVGNHEDAEDLAQETLVRAFFALKWFREDSLFTTWLYRIAVHLGRDLHRSQGRRPPAMPLSHLAIEPLVTSRGDDPGETTSQGELLRGVMQAI